MSKYKDIINNFANKNILVIGDIILDQHLQGSVSRISPEAPVPVVLQEKSFYSPGGASNVSHNLKQLGAKVTQIGKIGDDLEGRLLKKELENKGIDTKGIFIDKTLPTITKIRVIAGHQQVVRIDREDTSSQGDDNVAKEIKDFVNQNIEQYDGIILSDYGKGIITSEFVELIRELALKKSKIITVDPKDDHFMYYRNVTGITPNKKEAENAIRHIKIRDEESNKLNISIDKLNSDDLVERAGKELLDYLDLDSLLITLGEKGMRLFEKDKKSIAIETKAKEVYDVTGAGDTVISVFTLALTAGASKYEAADLANSAAGIVVGHMGAIAINKDELIEAVC